MKKLISKNLQNNFYGLRLLINEIVFLNKLVQMFINF